MGGLAEERAVRAGCAFERHVLPFSPLPLVTIEATAAEVLSDGRHDLFADLDGDDSQADVHQVFNCLSDFIFDIVR